MQPNKKGKSKNGARRASTRLEGRKVVLSCHGGSLSTVSGSFRGAGRQRKKRIADRKGNVPAKKRRKKEGADTDAGKGKVCGLSLKHNKR